VLAPIQNLSTALQEQTQDEKASTPIGEDVSQIVPPDHGGERDSTQHREPAFVRDEPTTSQIREPEAANSTLQPGSSLHNGDKLPSPQPFIKDEPSGTPREHTPAVIASQSERQGSVTGENMDADALKALEIAKQSDLGLRRRNHAYNHPWTRNQHLPRPKNDQRQHQPLLLKRRVQQRRRSPARSVRWRRKMAQHGQSRLPRGYQSRPAGL
jgi:hypothetical protein